MRNLLVVPARPLLLTLAALGAACAPGQIAPKAPVPPPSAAPAPAAPTVTDAGLVQVCKKARDVVSRRADPHEDLAAILWQQTAAEYAANTTTVYRGAAHALAGLVGSDKNAVVVFDLDETVLDNSRFQGRLLAEARNYESSLWDCWVGQKQATRIAGAELLFREMTRLGVRGRFVTNRRCRARVDGGDPCPQVGETLENLNALLADTGYVATLDEMLLLGAKVPGGDGAWEDEKQPRRDFVAKTHRIAMLVGDDLGDFLEGVRKTTIARRAELTARHADRWGTSWFQLPNPSYGSWVTAVDEEAPRKRHEVVEAFAYPKP